MASRFRILVGLLVLVLLASLGYLLVHVRRQATAIRDLQWRAELLDMAPRNFVASLDQVGAIQFLGEGYSITLDSVSYEASGLRLVGRLGNHNALNISSLTLGLDVRRPFSTLRKQFIASKSLPDFYSTTGGFSDLPIGKAQVVIGDLPAGTQASFSVIIPNVRQTKETFELVISFAGARYAYLR
jgi:hypothetical protein